jgi:hypothetical protein
MIIPKTTLRAAMTANIELRLEDRFIVEALMFRTRRALEILDGRGIIQHGAGIELGKTKKRGCVKTMSTKVRCSTYVMMLSLSLQNALGLAAVFENLFRPSQSTTFVTTITGRHRLLLLKGFDRAPRRSARSVCSQLMYVAGGDLGDAALPSVHGGSVNG